MTYFNQLKQPDNVIQKQNSINMFNILLNRIEQRAIEVVRDKYPYMMDLIGSNPIIIDPYANYSPTDTKIWLDVFIAAQSNRELYSRLFFIRGAGTMLMKNPKWGYVFQPVIGQNGWSSMDEYNKEKQCLNEYGSEIIQLFKKLDEKS